MNTFYAEFICILVMKISTLSIWKKKQFDINTNNLGRFNTWNPISQRARLSKPC